MKLGFEPKDVYIRPLREGELAEEGLGHFKYGAFYMCGELAAVFEQREVAFISARQNGVVPYDAH